MGKVNLPEGWNDLVVVPPDEVVEVIDGSGNTGLAQPCYYPFETVKLIGDERKGWGWRGTPIFYTDGKSRWDGSWMIYVTLSDVNKIGEIIGWKKYNPEN